MKEITIDWVEYILLKKEKATLEVEDKYRKIREVVSIFGDVIYIHWEKRTLESRIDWTIILQQNKERMFSWLHFQECTLWDLKENDVFIFEGIIHILTKIKEFSCFTNFLLLDRIRDDELFDKNAPVIKILRH